MVERQAFFFEKKKQKTFVPFAGAGIACPAAKRTPMQPKRVKVFWSFFSKKDCFLLLLLLPHPAKAHAQLEQAHPPVGSTVTTAPAELQLDFSEAIEPGFTQVTVTNAEGAAMTTAPPHTAPDSGAHLLVPVRPLPPGAYAVTWHAVSVDTHRTQGAYRFTIAPPKPADR